MTDFGLLDTLVRLLTSELGSQIIAHFGAIFAWGMAVAYLVAGAHSLHLFDRRPIEEQEPLWLTDGTGYPVAVNVLIAVGEEILFRSHLQSLALTVADPIYALFAVNLIFALIHLKGGLTFALSAGFFGMMASVMTLASGSLLPAIAMHGGWNVLIGIARKREATRIQRNVANSGTVTP